MNLNDLLKGLEADAQIEKSASVSQEVKPAVSAELASVLEKKASEDMTKKAFAEGEALARQLLAQLNKQADDFAANSAENNILSSNADMVADDDTKIKPNSGGSLEDVLQNTVNNGTATGAATDNRVDGEGTHANNVAPAGDPVAGEKQASEAAKTEQNKEEITMDKSASDNQLAKFIMEKLAQEFSPEVTTAAAGVNTAAAPAPNKIQRDNAVMTAQHDASTQGIVPGGDGTINALFETIVAKAKAQGGTSGNLIDGDPTVQRDDLQTGGPGPVSEGQEKAAAVAALCDAGMDFETAVDLVKQAEEEILGEAWEQEKRACFNQLVAEGVDFDTAIALIKQAEEDLAKQADAK